MDPIAMGDHLELGPELAVQQAWEGVPVVNLDTRMRDDPSDVSNSHGVWDDLRLAWLYAHRASGFPTPHVEPLR